MHCTQCGTKLTSTTNFCPQCGAANETSATPTEAEPTKPAPSGDDITKTSRGGFLRGTATRLEYILVIGVYFLLFAMGVLSWPYENLLHILISLIAGYAFCFVLPATIRRLHDTGHSGFWIVLMALIPIMIFVLMIWPSKKKGNKYDAGAGKRPLHWQTVLMGENASQTAVVALWLTFTAFVTLMLLSN